MLNHWYDESNNDSCNSFGYNYSGNVVYLQPDNYEGFAGNNANAPEIQPTLQNYVTDIDFNIRDDFRLTDYQEPRYFEEAKSCNNFYPTPSISFNMESSHFSTKSLQYMGYPSESNKYRYADTNQPANYNGSIWEQQNCGIFEDCQNAFTPADAEQHPFEREMENNFIHYNNILRNPSPKTGWQWKQNSHQLEVAPRNSKACFVLVSGIINKYGLPKIIHRSYILPRILMLVQDQNFVIRGHLLHAEFFYIDQEQLLKLTSLAHYLATRWLLDVTCKTVVNPCTKGTSQEFSQTFNLKISFDPEKKGQSFPRDNAWCRH